jgi:hypothetical protein
MGTARVTAEIDHCSSNTMYYTETAVMNLFHILPNNIAVTLQYHISICLPYRKYARLALRIFRYLDTSIVSTTIGQVIVR